MKRLSWFFALVIVAMACQTENIAPQGEKIGLDFTKTSGRVKAGVAACANDKYALDVANGKFMDIGEVEVYKDQAQSKLYVTISINDLNDPWFIAKSSLNVGKVAGKNGKVVKNPAPGQFAYQAAIPSNNNTGNKEYTFEFPLSQFDGMGLVDFVLHAEVIRVETNEDGSIKFTDGMATIAQREGAWAGSIKYFDGDNSNWAKFFQYDIKKECDVCDPVWQSLTGGGEVAVAISEENLSKNNTYEDSIIFDLTSGNLHVGKATLTYIVNKKDGNPNEGKISVKFDVNELDAQGNPTGYKIVNAGGYYQTTAFTLNDISFESYNVGSYNGKIKNFPGGGVLGTGPIELGQEDNIVECGTTEVCTTTGTGKDKVTTCVNVPVYCFPSIYAAFYVEVDGVCPK